MSKPLIAMVGGVVIAGSAVMYINAQKVPEGTMTVEETDSIEFGEPLADVKVPVELSSAAMVGQRIFNAKCSACHGDNAAGQNGIAPPLINDIYRPGHHGEAAFVSAAQNGVQSHHWEFGNMPPVDGITRADIKSVVTFIRELQRENGIN